MRATGNVTTALLSLPITALAAAASSGAPTFPLPLPERLLVCPWGESRDLSGAPVICDETTAATLSANQSKMGRDEVVLDFEHSTFTAKSGDPQRIAAVGALSVVAGEGIYFTPRYWTAEGEASYTGGHYPDLSPTVIRDAAGRVLALHSVALTRAGQIPTLHAFSADQIAALSADLFSNTTDTTMDYKAIVAEMLGLPADATDEEITAAHEGKKAKPAPDVTALSAELISFQAELDKLKRANLITHAKLAGKAIPLSADAMEKLPFDALSTMLDGLPAGAVPLAGQTPKTEPAPGPVALSAQQQDIAKQLGLTADQYRAASI